MINRSCAIQDPTAETPAVDQQNARRWGRHARNLVLIVASIQFSQAVDRSFLSVALESIRKEFHLSDSLLGLLNGVAFALCCGLAAVPIARLAELRGRRPIITLSIAVWTVFEAVAAYATGFASLFLARVFVGIGDAGGTPACQSLIAANFPPQRRAGALSIMYAGGYLGIVLGLAIGGVAIESVGWRAALLALAVFGAILTPVAWMGLREESRPATPAGNTFFRDVAYLLRSPAIRHFAAMLCLMGLATFGTVLWAPTFYIRYYGLDAKNAGELLGFIIGGGMLLGSVLGGAVANRLNGVRKGAGVSFSCWALAAYSPVVLSVFMVSTASTSLALLFISMLVGGLTAGPIWAVLHDLVQPRLRAVVVALCNVASIAIGGFGPLLVGMGSDLVGGHDSNNLRTALIGINILNVWVAFHAFRLRHFYRRQIANQAASNPGVP